MLNTVGLHSVRRCTAFCDVCTVYNILRSSFMITVALYNSVHSSRRHASAAHQSSLSVPGWSYSSVDSATVQYIFVLYHSKDIGGFRCTIMAVFTARPQVGALKTGNDVAPTDSSTLILVECKYLAGIWGENGEFWGILDTLKEDCRERDPKKALPLTKPHCLSHRASKSVGRSGRSVGPDTKKD